MRPGLIHWRDAARANGARVAAVESPPPPPKTCGGCGQTLSKHYGGQLCPSFDDLLDEYIAEWRGQ